LVETLALRLLRELSRLEEEFERLKLDVWLVLMLMLTRFSELSILDEEFERLKLEV
jgi:hypothetical protein